MMRKNPQKVKQWFMMASTVREMSDSLYNYAQALKVAIVREADGEKGDPLNIEGKDNIEAASYIMLNPANGQGHKLYEAINSYRARILQFVTDHGRRRLLQVTSLRRYLTTQWVRTGKSICSKICLLRQR